MKRSNLTSLLITIVVILVLAIGFVVLRSRGLLGGIGGEVQKDSGSNISDDSAVFLTNGQVYFGKIYGRSNGLLDLRDIYYLQVANQTVQPDQKAAAAASPSPSPQVSLVKLGNELHGPNDRMLINESQILFTESLKSDSKVVKAIANTNQ